MDFSRGSFAFYRLVISALAQWRLGNLGRPWSTHHPHVLGWLHKDLYLYVNVGWMVSLPRLYMAFQSIEPQMDKLEKFGPLSRHHSHSKRVSSH